MSQTSYEVHGEVAVVTIANPPANLFTREIGDGVTRAVARATDEGRRAMVLQADGAQFSGGADVSLFKGLSTSDGRNLIADAMPMITALEDAPFPVIAAVQGLCLAAGLELALACDLIIAAEDARFAQVEAMIGAATFLGGVYRLAERCGPARARQIVFDADFHSAETFERWNIVNKVAPNAELRARALAWARRLATGPTAAHAVHKRLLRHAREFGTRATDEYMSDIAAPLFETRDMQNAVGYLLTHGARKFRENHDEIVFEAK
jgi:enoyl-CoA hydratase/carnithine racemase